jgi:hypothetical protein
MSGDWQMPEDTKTLVKIGTNEPIDVADLTKPLPLRDFRDAWQLQGTVISIDMKKAKESSIERIRREREPRLSKLDGLWNRATGQKKPEEAEAVEAKRQKLRDMTTDKRLNASTPEKLKEGVDAILEEMDALASA